MSTKRIRHMKTHTIEKPDYTAPLIERIKLDNEISLVLDSTPPFGPSEMSVMSQDFLINETDIMTIY